MSAPGSSTLHMRYRTVMVQQMGGGGVCLTLPLPTLWMHVQLAIEDAARGACATAVYQTAAGPGALSGSCNQFNTEVRTDVTQVTQAWAHWHSRTASMYTDVAAL